ncbi:MAG: 3-hydroxyacyl-CoA dehydrogenase NAD-binding domain-containing protein [Gaiellaceae bacterium]
MTEIRTEFRLQRVDTQLGPLALLTMDNGEDHTKPTVLGRSAIESGQRALDEIEAGEWVALVVTGKPFVFAAGADIDEFPRVRSREEAIAGSRAGHDLFGRMRALPFPTVAAVNGVCLGGGLEVALHCDARTIASSVRHFGAPECFLGIIPAWGGTQLLPRLAGAQTAVRVIVENAMRQNRMLRAAEAVELGLADRMLDPVEFLDESIAYALELAEQDGPHREPADLSDAADVVARARAQLDASLHGAAPAPYRALELIEGAATWSIEEGYRAEEETAADLLFSSQARASLYAFDLVERRARRRPGIPDTETRRIRKVGIVGAGLMASQLATLFLRRLEVPIVLRDVREEAIASALDGIHGELAAQAAKGRYDEGKARFLGELVTGSTAYHGFADCDLVLEAVFEEIPIKQQVFAEVEALVRPDCILATNTSALSVTAVGAELEHPERLVGMHFFNPVAMMPLVELVGTAAADDVSLATAAAVCTSLGKRPVPVRDAPGFVVNRLLTRMTSTLMEALERGNTIEETDEAVLRLGLPMAPSVLLQMVGPRVAWHVLETMHAAYPERFPLSETLRSIAEGTEPPPPGSEPASVESITDAVLEALADESRRLLDEGVVASAADIDTCLLLGAGFPFFLGGITRHLDDTGVSERVLGRRLADAAAAVPA